MRNYLWCPNDHRSLGIDDYNDDDDDDEATTTLLLWFQIGTNNNNNNNDKNEILIECEPLVYTRAQHTVQKNKKYHLG